MEYSNTPETSIFLSLSEVIDLTHKRMQSAQVRALRQMGIDHITRPDGTLVILRSHVEKVLAGENPRRARIEIQPDWKTINVPKKKPRK